MEHDLGQYIPLLPAHGRVAGPLKRMLANSLNRALVEKLKSGPKPTRLLKPIFVAHGHKSTSSLWDIQKAGAVKATVSGPRGGLENVWEAGPRAALFSLTPKQVDELLVLWRVAHAPQKPPPKQAGKKKPISAPVQNVIDNGEFATPAKRTGPDVTSWKLPKSLPARADGLDAYRLPSLVDGKRVPYNGVRPMCVGAAGPIAFAAIRQNGPQRAPR